VEIHALGKSEAATALKSMVARGAVGPEGADEFSDAPPHRADYRKVKKVRRE
jgi:hypothetical protein